MVVNYQKKKKKQTRFFSLFINWLIVNGTVTNSMMIKWQFKYVVNVKKMMMMMMMFVCLLCKLVASRMRKMIILDRYFFIDRLMDALIKRVHYSCQMCGPTFFGHTMSQKKKFFFLLLSFNH